MFPGQQPNTLGAKAPGGFDFRSTTAASGATPAGSGFAFGGFGTTTAPTTQQGFPVGGTQAAASMATPSVPFSFGSTATSTPAAAAPFSFSLTGGTAAPPMSSTPASSISLGTTAPKTAGGLTFGAAPSGTSTSSTLSSPGGFAFGGATIGSTSVKPTAAQGGILLGNTASPATTSTLGPVSVSTPFAALPTAGSRTQATGLSLGLGASTASTGQGFQQPTATTKTAGFGTSGTIAGFGVGLPKPTTIGTIGTGTTATTLGSITSTGGTGVGVRSLGSTPSTAAATTAVGFGISAASTAATSASSTTQRTVSTVGVVASSTPQLSYKQLEEQINKWVSDLEDYERTFLDQAGQVNAWDRLLMENGEKITELNGNVESVKAEQKRLDEELDFILAQQQELEVLLKPLEEELQKRSTGPGQLQHADREREFTYGLAKDVDGQLKQMVGDLKAIIDHLNAAGSTQQENNDPIVQVAKILNAHMNSLQWIDQNAALLQRKVDEVSSLSEIRRKEQERNFRLAFD